MDASDARPFGALLRSYRVTAGLSQEELAERASLSTRTVSDLERGVTASPYRGTVALLAEALELDEPDRVALERAVCKSRAPVSAHEEKPAPSPSGPLLETKLAIPPARVNLVPRPSLVERLHAALQGPLTLLSAPAGSGKTTLVSAWRVSRQGRLPPLAWVSLDEGDNDPVRFWRYVVASLNRAVPGVGESVLTLLHSSQSPSIEGVLVNLLNALDVKQEDIVLALDDYHLIEDASIHQMLAFLLERSPTYLHLLISTRADPPMPLARLRARGDVTELRAADLRFTSQEATAFLNTMMGLSLTPEEVEALEARTEGWVAGLQLAALSLKSRSAADVTAFIAEFAGNHRYIVDYLVDEVLLRQPEETQRFLLYTSILGRLCAPLCAAVMGEDDIAASQEALEELECRNVFVVSLDEERRWYRYHHLFRDFLRRRLEREHPQRHADLHNRASVWFEQHGSVIEAVGHALAADDTKRAVRLIEHAGYPILWNNQVYTVLRWIDALPDSLMRTRPALCILHALALMYTRQVKAAEARLRDAERCIPSDSSDDDGRTMLGQVALIRSGLARFTGDTERCVALARRALELFPELELTEVEAESRRTARVNALLTYRLSGDVTPDAERLIVATVASTRSASQTSGWTVLRTIANLARFRKLQGRLRIAADTYEEAARSASGEERLRGLIDGAAYYFGLGELYYEWNELDTAESHLLQGIELMKGGLAVDAEVVTLGFIALAHLRSAKGQHNEALAALAEFELLAHQESFAAPLRARVAAARARVWLAQGDLAAAARWAESSGLRTEGELSYPREGEYLTLARVLRAQGEHDEAPRLLKRLREAAETAGRKDSLIQILALEALTLRAKGENKRAVNTLEEALALAEPEGYVRTFADEGPPMAALLSEALEAQQRGRQARASRVSTRYLRKLLAVTAHTPPTERLPEQLSEREFEVLVLLAAGRSNPEIARELYVGINTIKTHLKSIYGKLAVNSRDRAVIRARELELL
jgi:LuxR family transcriptional regulator, maltose regulon positive regulatory protein